MSPEMTEGSIDQVGKRDGLVVTHPETGVKIMTFQPTTLRCPFGGQEGFHEEPMITSAYFDGANMMRYRACSKCNKLLNSEP